MNINVITKAQFVDEIPTNQFRDVIENIDAITNLEVEESATTETCYNFNLKVGYHMINFRMYLDEYADQDYGSCVGALDFYADYDDIANLEEIQDSIEDIIKQLPTQNTKVTIAIEYKSQMTIK